MGGRQVNAQKKPLKSGRPFDAYFTDVVGSAGLIARFTEVVGWARSPYGLLETLSGNRIPRLSVTIALTLPSRFVGS
jgi:hypothetical protein